MPVETITLRKTVAGSELYAKMAEYDSEGNHIASTKEDIANKVTTIREASSATDTAYPSEKAVATALAAKASTATTLAGYGITDASITESQGTKTVTLGNESLVPMLSASAPLQASGNSLSLTHTTATFITYVDSGDGTPLALDENTPMLADEVELVDSIGGKELLARRAYQDEDGNNIKDTYATKAELQAALGDIETLLAAL